MRLLLVAIAAFLSLPRCAGAQEEFEVASIKPHPEPITFSRDPYVRGNRVTSTASTLIDLIETAYHVRRDQISGLPAWAQSEHYDLDAKAGTDALTDEQMRHMLRSLLAQRFQLQIRPEKREVPMYDLVTYKSGPEFKESLPDEPRRGAILGRDGGLHMEVSHGTMADLAARLSGNGAGRPVVDKTGLTGKYSYQLNWVNATALESDLPPLPLALEEQLGLKLEPTKGVVETIVVVRVERPSAN